MRKKRHTAEQIITKLREAEVALSQGGTVPAACRKLGLAVLLRDAARAQHYERRGPVFESDAVFWPVTGKPTRPQWIYVKKELAVNHDS
jgi:hypothetical protein